MVVLGLGPGGEDLAEALGRADWSVVGADPHLVGGECPYYGCIPSKMMVRGADVLAEARRVSELAGAAEVHPDFRPVAERIRTEATDNWDDHVAVERFEGTGGRFVRGAGRLLGREDDGRLRVRAGEEELRARHVVIATGTAPALPPIDGLAELRASGTGPSGPVWTNREAVKAPVTPPSLVVLGGGPIGCELAQAFARFGTRVSVVEPGPQLLTREEPEAAATLTDVFTREGISVRTGAAGRAERVTAGGDGVVVHLADGGEVTGAKLLVAAGRVPNLAELGLDIVGLDPAARSVPVDEHMRALADGVPVPGLYAIGDIAGHGAFTHLAVWQSRVLAAHLLGRPEPFGGYHALAWATFTDPEVGHVGCTEAQARESGAAVRTGTAPIPANSRGWIHGPGNDGFVKVVADGDVLVGATVVAPHGGEILAVLTLAVHARVPVPTLLSMHYVFPTLHRAVLEALQALS